ncbi:MAG: hypothetical protein QM648_02770 [Solirubrobacterales bacterium]
MATQQVSTGFAPEIKSSRMKRQALGMFAIGIAMWVGVPAFVLAAPALLKNSTGLAFALAVGMIGAVIAVIVLVRLLGKLNTAWQIEYEELNDRRAQRTPLEPVMVISVMIALAVFGIWFMVFAGGGGSSNVSGNA